MINFDEMKQFIPTYSLERIKSFIYNPDDNINDVIKRYQDNIKISQALYPELATLEVILRNSIDSVFRTYISENWIEEEFLNNTLLEAKEYKLLVDAYKSTQRECDLNSKVFTAGKVIANLNFAFWTNLCMKKYNSKLWNKVYFFKGVFMNYPSKTQAIGLIANKLLGIRKLRNRIFHYEQIFKYPKKTLKLYNDIIEILSYLPSDNLSVIEETSNFLDVHNKLVASIK